MKHLPLAVALFLLTASLAVALPPDAPLPGDLEFEELRFDSPRPLRFELENGLIVHFLEDPSLPLVDVTVLVRVGAVLDPPETVGLADLVGTVMRTGGTRTRPPDQLNAELENMASIVEIRAGDEETTAYASSLARHFPATLAILADVLRNPAFAEEKLEIARAREIEAVRRQNDDPLEIVGREFSRLLYPEHPYGQSPTIETLSAITRDDLVDFHRDHFHPNPGRMVLAVSGAVTAEELRRLLDDHNLGDWELTSCETYPTPPVPEAAVPGVSLITKEVSQSAIRIGHLGIDHQNPDRVAVGVMNHILGRGGFNSRLVKRVRVEAGIAYSVGSVFSLPRARGLFFASTQTSSETTALAIELLTEEIRRMRDQGVTAEELEEAREAILNRDIFASATARRIVRRAAELEFDGFPPDQHQRDLEEIRAMTTERVDAVAAKYLQPEGLRILVVGNPEHFEKPLSILGEVNEIHLDGETDQAR